MKKIIKIKGLDCANCAAYLERKLALIDGMEDVSVNFISKRITVNADEDRMETVLRDVKKVTGDIEPDCVLNI